MSMSVSKKWCHIKNGHCVKDDHCLHPGQCVHSCHRCHRVQTGHCVEDDHRVHSCYFCYPGQCVHSGYSFHVVKMFTLSTVATVVTLANVFTLGTIATHDHPCQMCVTKNVRNKLDKQQTPCYSHQPPQGADIKLPPPPTHTNNNKQEACVEVGKKRVKTA